jgi:hypothetical protein
LCSSQGETNITTVANNGSDNVTGKIVRRHLATLDAVATFTAGITGFRNTVTWRAFGPPAEVSQSVPVILRTAKILTKNRKTF